MFLRTYIDLFAAFHLDCILMWFLWNSQGTELLQILSRERETRKDMHVVCVYVCFPTLETCHTTWGHLNTFPNIIFLHTHRHTHAYLLQRRPELADDTAPVWATAAAAAAGGAAESRRRGCRQPWKARGKIDFFYFTVNAISFGFVSVFVCAACFVPF